MKNKLLACLAALALAFMPTLSLAQNKETMSKKHKDVYDAAFALYAAWDGNKPQFICSATAVGYVDQWASGRYALLTAGHCVTGDGLPEDATFFVAEEISPKPELQPVKVLKAENDDKLDFAVLELDSPKTYPTIGIDMSDTPPAIEDDVFVINYSLGLGKQVALGKVASAPMTSAACQACEGRYLLHLFNGPGSSGAAVISEQTGKIVGIVELGFNRGTVGTAAETMKAFKQFLAKDLSTDPKADGPQGKWIAKR